MSCPFGHEKLYSSRLYTHYSHCRCDCEDCLDMKHNVDDSKAVIKRYTF